MSYRYPVFDSLSAELVNDEGFKNPHSSLYRKAVYFNRIEGKECFYSDYENLRELIKKANFKGESGAELGLNWLGDPVFVGVKWKYDYVYEIKTNQEDLKGLGYKLVNNQFLFMNKENIRELERLLSSLEVDYTKIKLVTRGNNSAMNFIYKAIPSWDKKNYIESIKREVFMRKTLIKEDIAVPGTGITLEKGDRIYFHEDVSDFMSAFEELLADNDIYLTDKKTGVYSANWKDFRTKADMYLEVDTNTDTVACSRNGNVIYDYKLRSPNAGLARIVMNDLEDAGAF